MGTAHTVLVLPRLLQLYLYILRLGKTVGIRMLSDDGRRLAERPLPCFYRANHDRCSCGISGSNVCVEICLLDCQTYVVITSKVDGDLDVFHCRGIHNIGGKIFNMTRRQWNGGP